MSKTLISWTDETVNPLTGCNEKGPECLNCYARIASASPRLQQFEKYHGVVDEKGRWTGQSGQEFKNFQQVDRSATQFVNTKSIVTQVKR